MGKYVCSGKAILKLQAFACQCELIKVILCNRSRDQEVCLLIRNDSYK